MTIWHRARWPASLKHQAPCRLAGPSGPATGTRKGIAHCDAPSDQPGSAQVKVSELHSSGERPAIAPGVSVSTGPSGSLLSRTAMTPGRLVATSTQLPPEALEKLDLRHSARSRSVFTGDLPWRNQRSSRARHGAGERRHAAGPAKDQSGPPRRCFPPSDPGPAQRQYFPAGIEEARHGMATAYRVRRQAGGPRTRTGRRSRPAARHARALEIRQQVSELAGSWLTPPAASRRYAHHQPPSAAPGPPRPPGSCTA